MGPFGMGDRPFDGNMFDLPIIVSPLPLGVKIGVGASSDCKDCAMGGESIGLLWRLTNLWRRWWRWVGVVWYWVCDLWY
jgi:hypothetical protein